MEIRSWNVVQNNTRYEVEGKLSNGLVYVLRITPRGVNFGVGRTLEDAKLICTVGMMFFADDEKIAPILPISRPTVFMLLRVCVNIYQGIEQIRKMKLDQ